MNRKILIALIFLFSAFMVFAQAEPLYRCMCQEGAPCTVVPIVGEVEARRAEAAAGAQTSEAPARRAAEASTTAQAEAPVQRAAEASAVEAPARRAEISETRTAEQIEAAARLARMAERETDDTLLIPEGILNNVYYLESLRYKKLAQDTFEYGDYDASAGFAREAIRYAELSDEYVTEQLLAEAKRLLDSADANNIANRNPDEYNQGLFYYEEGITAQKDKNWNEAIPAAIKSIEILSKFDTGKSVLPAQFTVRAWEATGDSLSIIAGYSFIYGDPYRWTELYNANRSRLQDPNNPHLIQPGFVLDIPSIRGEVRQGMWDPNRKYE